MVLAENKADLACFLSEEIVGHRQDDKTIVVAGEFSDEERVESTNPEVDTSKFETCHEEADTRIVLHCVQNPADSIVVQARDTDILVLLIAHYHRMPCTKSLAKGWYFQKEEIYTNSCNYRKDAL